MDYNQLALQKHKELRGKIGLQLKDELDTPEKLSTYYSPGVGAVSSYVAEHPEETRDYTWTNNTVAVISDGSAVLGLGDLGPYGALPVMEGKAMLFKHFAGVDAVPIVLDVHSADEIVAAAKAIARFSKRSILRRRSSVKRWRRRTSTRTASATTSGGSAAIVGSNHTSRVGRWSTTSPAQ